MDKHIEALIVRTIAHTRAYLGAPGGDRRAARAGLARILADLAARAPGHPALARLGDILDEIADAPAPADPTGR